MPTFQRCAGAVVLDNAGRLLMVRRGHDPGRGLWTIPGGRCLDNESAENACAREVEEETGLLVRVGVELGQTQLGARDDVVYDITDFRCEVVGGALRAGDDADEVGWVARMDFDSLPLVGGLREFLADRDLLPR